MNIVKVILDAGPVVMMPIVLFILALIFGQKIGKSIRAAIIVGVGFVGIFAVLGAVFDVAGPVIQDMFKNLHLSLKGVDIGWPLTSAITWAIPLAAVMIPVGFLVNLGLLFLGWTKTFDADLWNYWHWAFTAVMVYMWTKNIWLSYAVAVAVEIIILELADWVVPLTQKYFGIPGTSLPHTETVNWAPFTLAMEKLFFSKWKKISSLRLDPEGLSKKLGYFGEPVMLGFYIGLLIGILGRASVVNTLKIGIYIAGLMYLEGRMVGVLIEGLMPIADGINQQFAKSKKFANRKIYIGIDAGPIGLANPTAIFVGYLMLPVILVLSFIPGNHILPLADLAILPVFVMYSAAASRGNVVKTFFNALVVIALILYMTNVFAGPLTEAAKSINYTLPAGALLVSSLDAGAHLITFIIAVPIIAFSLGKPSMAIAPIILGILFVLSWWYAKDQPKKLTEKIIEEEGSAEEVLNA